MAQNNRNALAALVLSAAAFAGILLKEGYSDTAIIPTKNDRPTVGHGSTFYANGAPVKLGDKITPAAAVELAKTHISKKENRFRHSLPGVKLTQAEYDIYMDWTYQFGTGAWGKSSMRRELIAGNYVPACKALLKYKYSGGYDCSIPGNRICSGVWKRQQERFNKCMGAQ